jgi:hypothetical protein
MDLLGDVGHVESHFSPFGDRVSVSVSARLDHGLHHMYHRLRNHLGRTRLYNLVTRLKWMLILVCLEIVLIVTQVSCMVCAECTIGSEIVLDAPNGTPR